MCVCVLLFQSHVNNLWSRVIVFFSCLWTAFDQCCVRWQRNIYAKRIDAARGGQSSAGCWGSRTIWRVYDFYMLLFSVAFVSVCALRVRLFAVCVCLILKGANIEYCELWDSLSLYGTSAGELAAKQHFHQFSNANPRNPTRTPNGQHHTHTHSNAYNLKFAHKTLTIITNGFNASPDSTCQ